jgi:hypothetical protein
MHYDALKLTLHKKKHILSNNVLSLVRTSTFMPNYLFPTNNTTTGK